MLASRQLLVAAFMLTTLAWPVAGRANVRADFNGDGVVDVASLEPGSPAVIVVALSGSQRTLRLVIPERPLSIAAVDIDADGRIDLVGTSRSRGLFFWRNRPGARFKNVPRSFAGRKIHIRVPATSAERRHYSSRSKSDDTAVDSAGPDDAPGVVESGTRADILALAGSRFHAPTNSRIPFGFQRSSPSRAPPA
jgi:hypothetical protein